MSRIPFLDPIAPGPKVPEESIATPSDFPLGVWIPINSTWLNAARYHPATQSFDIRTKENRVYPNYPNCPPEKFREFLRAPSKGQWMWRNYPPRKH